MTAARHQAGRTPPGQNPDRCVPHQAEPDRGVGSFVRLTRHTAVPTTAAGEPVAATRFAAHPSTPQRPGLAVTLLLISAIQRMQRIAVRSRIRRRRIDMNCEPPERCQVLVEGRACRQKLPPNKDVFRHFPTFRRCMGAETISMLDDPYFDLAFDLPKQCIDGIKVWHSIGRI